MATLSPNSFTPKKGDVAIFHYEKSGLKHVAVVEYVFTNGYFWVSECNYTHGECEIRYLSPHYKNLVGFYTGYPQP